MNFFNPLRKKLPSGCSCPLRILLDLFHITINQLSIVGMVVALGLLVDDSIVVVENIERYLRMGYGKKEAAMAATPQSGHPAGPKAGPI